MYYYVNMSQRLQFHVLISFVFCFTCYCGAYQYYRIGIIVMNGFNIKITVSLGRFPQIVCTHEVRR